MQHSYFNLVGTLKRSVSKIDPFLFFRFIIFLWNGYFLWFSHTLKLRQTLARTNVNFHACTSSLSLLPKNSITLTFHYFAIIYLRIWGSILYLSIQAVVSWSDNFDNYTLYMLTVIHWLHYFYSMYMCIVIYSLHYPNATVLRYALPAF